MSDVMAWYHDKMNAVYLNMLFYYFLFIQVDEIKMSRRLQRYLVQLLICIPLISLCGVVILMTTCGPENPKKDCPKDTSLQSVKNLNVEESDAAKPYSAFLVILIMSGPKLLAGRQILRDTWLSLRNSDVLLRFVIGTAELPEDQLKQLERERDSHGDILLIPTLKDGFYALTQKLIDMLTWVDHNVDYSFVLKVDDDSFVRLDALINELQQKSRERLFWGFFDGRARVHKSGKYAEADWVLCDRYLPYAKGGGYVLSADLVHFVSENGKYLKKYSGEDVSLGSWLAALEVNREHDPRFDTEYLSRGCFNSYLVTHKQSPEDMRNKWKHYKNTGKLCEKEFQLRPSYMYNWDKPPTECCKRVNGIP